MVLIGIIWEFTVLVKCLMGSYKLSSVTFIENLQSFILALYCYKAPAINPGQL